MNYSIFLQKLFSIQKLQILMNPARSIIISLLPLGKLVGQPTFFIIPKKFIKYINFTSWYLYLSDFLRSLCSKRLHYKTCTAKK